MKYEDVQNFKNILKEKIERYGTKSTWLPKVQWMSCCEGWTK